jgi:hypothetical protein
LGSQEPTLLAEVCEQPGRNPAKRQVTQKLILRIFALMGFTSLGTGMNLSSRGYSRGKAQKQLLKFYHEYNSQKSDMTALIMFPAFSKA